MINDNSILDSVMPKMLLTIFLISIINSECLAQHWRTYENNVYDDFLQDSRHSHATYDSALADSGRNTKMPGYLNPEHAFWLAFFPGLIVRGAGHIYARKYFTTTAIIATTAVGLYLYLTAEDPSGWEGLDGYGRPWAHENKYYYWQKHSGLVLFWGAWAYDMIAAPIICIRHNRKVKETLSVRPCLLKNRNGALAGIQESYQF